MVTLLGDTTCYAPPSSVCHHKAKVVSLSRSRFAEGYSSIRLARYNVIDQSMHLILYLGRVRLTKWNYILCHPRNGFLAIALLNLDADS